jgi:hypothetical protein
MSLQLRIPLPDEAPCDRRDEPLGEQSFAGEEQHSDEHEQPAAQATSPPPAAEGQRPGETAVPPPPCIVEGTVVESILLSRAAADEDTEETAGTRVQDAKVLLLHTPGIRAVTITLSGGNGSTLPTNPDQITIRLLIVVGP